MPRTATAERTAAVAPGSTTTLNITFSGSLQLDAYKPSGSSRPALVIVHGGGWFSGDKSGTEYRTTAELFAGLGLAVFNANHTLVPAGNTNTTLRQTLVTDVMNAVQWVRDNAATYNVDSTRVAALGLSSGGHLALMAACQGTVGTTRPDAVVSWSAPTRLENLTGNGATYAADYLGEAISSAAADTFSPYYQIAAGDPPLRIVNSANEPSNDDGIAQAQADEMHTAALAVGVDSTKVIFAGTLHAFFRSVDLSGTAGWLTTKMGTALAANARTAATGRPAATGRVAA